MAYYKVTQKQSGGSATLITKSITANGTYNASSDNADGYSQVTVTVPDGYPYSEDRDVWGALDASKTNVSKVYSDYETSARTTSMVSFRCTAGSGYEGLCLTFPSGYNLVDGTSYNLKFTLTIPSGINISSSNQWGCKWTATKITNFNTTPDVNFTRTAGITENITVPFTAGSSNYFAIILSALSNTSNAKFTLTNITIEEATT